MHDARRNSQFCKLISIFVCKAKMFPSSLKVAALFLAVVPRVCLGNSSPTQDGFFSDLVALNHTFEKAVIEYERCNSEIVDVHLHDAEWVETAETLLAEMDSSHISKAIMLAVYGPVAGPLGGGDPNEVVEAIVDGSGGRIFGLASLNTTDPDQVEAELSRLATFLAKKPSFVGAKFAPPHNCLKLNSKVMRDIVQTVSESLSPVAFIHTGTTPFCGPMGAAILGRPGCCGREYVDPSTMEDLIQDYTNTKFVLVHAGADFLPPTEEHFYNGSNVEESLRLAKSYDNVYLEISAFLRQDENQNDVYEDGFSILQKIADAGLARKTIYGSDVNHRPNAMAPYLSTAVEKLMDADFTDEERCMILAGNAHEIFGLHSENDFSVENNDDDVARDESSARTFLAKAGLYSNILVVALHLVQLL